MPGLSSRKSDTSSASLGEDRASAYNRSLLEASLDPLVTIGPDGKIADVNAATEAVTGCTRAALIGTDFSDYFTEPEKARAGYLQVFREGLVRDYPLELRHRDGRITSVLYNASVYRDESGKVIGVFAAARDVTARRRAEAELETYRQHLEDLIKERTSQLETANAQLQAEISERKRIDEALRESSEDYRSLFENMLEGFAYCKMLFDDSGRPIDFVYLDVNRAFGALTGLKDAVGKKSSEVVPGLNEAHPELLEIYGRVASTGQPEKFEIELKPLGKWFSIAAYSTENGYFTAVFDNITERKQAEAVAEASRQALERERDLLQCVMNGAKNSHLVYLDRDFNFVCVNEAYAASCGYTPEEMIGKNHFALYPDAENEAIFARVRDTGEPAEFHDKPFVFPDQPERGLTYWDWTLIPVRAGNGDVAGLVLSLVETTARKQAEEALREGEQQFRTLANSIPTLCWMANADGWIFWYNQRWYDYTGTTPEQMKGWGWQSVHDPAELPNVLERWRGSIQKAEPFEMVFPLRGADGVFRSFLTRIVPVKDASGKVVRWFGTNYDISAQKQVEAELRKSKERLDLAVEVADLGEWDLDLGDHTASRSLRHDQIFGYESRLPEWTYEKFLDHVLPEHRADVDEKFKASLASGTWDFETPIRRVDGEVRWIWARGRSQLDERGQPTRMFGTVMDITERKRAEEALRQSGKRFAAVVNSAMDAIITVDQEQRIVMFNAAAEKIFGCPAAEAIGQQLDRFIPERFREIHRRHVGHFGKTGVTSRSMQSPGTLYGLRANGQEFPLEATISHVAVAGQKLYTVILRDITQRKQTETALLTSEKLATVGRLAATVAHEINNPLAAVTNLLFLMQQNPTLDDSGRTYLATAQAEVERAAHIAKQTLGFSKGGGAISRFRPTEVLENVLLLCQPKLQNKQIECQRDFHTDMVVSAAESEIRQVFWNLLSNAIDAVPQGGCIKVRVSASLRDVGSRGVRVTIGDNGHGISADHLPRLFEPFFTTRHTGNGLGLWITSQIVNKHGGSIRVRSRAGRGERSGTVFSVFLPAEPPRAAEGDLNYSRWPIEKARLFLLLPVRFRCLQ